VAPTSLFSEARTAKSPSKRRRRRASPLFLTISLDLSISVSPVAHLPSFFFQRKQEEKKNKKKPSLSLFFFFFSLSLSQTGNAEGTAPRTETSLLNSLPIPEIAVWKRSILLFREKEQRAARARARASTQKFHLAITMCSQCTNRVHGRLLTARAINLIDEDAITFT